MLLLLATWQQSYNEQPPRDSVFKIRSTVSPAYLFYRVFVFVFVCLFVCVCVWVYVCVSMCAHAMSAVLW